MGDPFRKKLKVVLYTSLALVLALGLASGFRWVQGGEAATVRIAAAPVDLPSTEATAGPAGQDAGAVTDNMQTLARVNQAFVAVAGAVTPAVVSVVTLGSLTRARLPQRFEDLFGPFQQEGPRSPFDAPLGRGSGFIVSKDGYVLTNNHVVAQAEKIRVELPDGRQFEGELVGRDPTTDIAVLKIDGEDLPTVKLGDPERTAVGEFVLAIGNPGTEFASELPFTVTAGIISAKGRNLGIIQRAANDNPYAIEDLIQTDAVINPGNSGGPLVNYRGEVIGVNTAIQSTTGYYQGYGFAIPISLAKNVMDDLIEYGRVRRAALRVSVTPVTREDVKAYQLPDRKGAVVQDFPDRSPAEKAGIQPGDVIVAVDGKIVERVGQLQSIIASYEPGAKVQVRVIRYGKPMTFTVKLAEADLPQPRPTVADSGERPGNMLIGVQVSDLNPQLAERAGFDPGTDLDGVVVTDVARFGPAWNATLRPGWLIQRVNGKRVKGVDDFDEAMSEVRPGDIVSVQAVRPGADGGLLHRIFNMEVPKE
jgi:serine protease Do